MSRPLVTALRPGLLVARTPDPTFRAFSFYKDFTLRGDLADAIAPEGRPLHFTTHRLTLASFHIADDTRYHACFKRSEPLVVLGTTDSGIPNRPRADGPTFLDALWHQDSFDTSAHFIQSVRAPSPTGGCPRACSRGWSATGLSPRRSVLEALRTRAAAARPGAVVARPDLGGRPIFVYVPPGRRHTVPL
ncbi:hypothetical protein EJ357_02155 [Streptomyces cyaneochromogenes]|uniref:Uncharacterized protein n=1 Tax=Streptomyces cyaneochromogenes TaxID=2496836 RepID=A0A3S9LZR3_9ACTN|nr:hypothetical protein [Streptomyces cyaneochromogenes]AZQ32399.1 hypothetical protein EJ357_02155 [Streptomyces cyaneochromogenes]